ncbi:S-layer homology domain-containing protein, partial [Desulfobacter latus]
TSAQITCTPSITGSQRFYVAKVSQGEAISGSKNLYVTVNAPDPNMVELFKEQFKNYNTKVCNILNDKNIDSHLSRSEAVILIESFLSHKAEKFKAKSMEDYFLPFADVDYNTDYYDSLLKLCYYLGDEDDTTPITKNNELFRPLDKVSRQEFIAITLQGLDLPLIENIDYLSDKFTDLGDVADWAMKYFNTAVRHQLMSGNNGELKPKDPLSVYEALVILGRVQQQFEGNYCHNDTSFKNPENLDVQKLLLKNIGFEYEPQYYESDAQGISITNVTESRATSELCGIDNALILSVTAETDSSKNDKVSEYYWWSSNQGYFREYPGSENFKKVCFFPATVMPKSGYSVLVSGGDNIGYVDRFTYEIKDQDFLHENDDIAQIVEDVESNPSFSGEKFMTSGKAYKLDVSGGFESSGIKIGIEHMEVTFSSESLQGVLFRGRPFENLVIFIPPDMPELYGEYVDIQIALHTQNKTFTQIISNIKYLPKFIVRGKVYNVNATDEADSIYIGDQQVYLDENNEFFWVIDSTDEILDLSVSINNESEANLFDDLTIDLTYDNPQKFIVMIGKNDSGNLDMSDAISILKMLTTQENYIDLDLLKSDELWSGRDTIFINDAVNALQILSDFKDEQ